MFFAAISARSGSCTRRFVRSSRCAAVLALSAAAMALPTAALAGDRGAFPAAQLPQPARGDEAVRGLGGQLPAVAAWYGMTPQRFAEILRQDRNAWLDRTGRLYYQDEFPAMPQSTTGAEGSLSTAQAAPYDLGQTFLLHSKPGSARVLYLDFDGHAATNTAWNSGTINAPAYDLDGNPAGMSDAEKERIQNIWLRVAEDYAPFDVDVTTQEPAASALLRTSSSDNAYGMRVVITHSSIGVCSGCAGIAFVGAYDFYDSANPGVYQPAWVLYDRLGAGDEKYVAEAIAHEAGHTAGLNHDGTTAGGAYYVGHGSGATGWAPIMGLGYYQNLSQWSRGDYPDASNHEDDLAIMPTYGLALRADDVGSSIGTAASLQGSSSGGVVSVDQSGLIERATDVDYYAFSTAGGSVSLGVVPAARGPNLDLLATVYNASGAAMGSANDPVGVGATLNLNLPAGSYYLAIFGVGDIDPAPGYPDYASLGRYRISGSYADSGSTPTAMPPTATASATPSSGTAPLAVGFSSSGSSDPDGSIVAYAWSFGDGGSSSAANPSHTYGSGSYTATLTVTDSQGLKSSKNLAITASAPPVTRTMAVQSIALRALVYKSGSQCEASVSVLDNYGAPLVGATVSGSWSGVSLGSSSALTGSNGVAVSKSSRVKARTGTCAYTVNGLSLTNYSYDGSRNAETSDSLSY